MNYNMPPKDDLAREGYVAFCQRMTIAELKQVVQETKGPASWGNPCYVFYFESATAELKARAEFSLPAIDALWDLAAE